MTSEQFDALIDYINAVAEEAAHRASHGSASSYSSDLAFEILRMSGIVDDGK